MTAIHFRAGAKLGALTSTVALGSFVTVKHVEDAAKALEDIAASLTRIGEIVDELGGNCEQRSGSERIDDVIAEVQQLTRANTELLGRTTRVATALKERTQHLVDVVARAADQAKHHTLHA